MKYIPCFSLLFTLNGSKFRQVERKPRRLRTAEGRRAAGEVLRAPGLSAASLKSPCSIFQNGENQL